MNDLFAITTGILFGMGVFQLLRRDLIKTAMGYYILFTAINFLLLAVGMFDGNTSAYVAHEFDETAPLYLDAAGQLEQQIIEVDGQPEQAQASDPLVQALILTAIVISFGSYALLLGMINLTADRNQSIDTDESAKLQG